MASASGSEADDESPVMLKGLPAPLWTQRKGLRGTQGAGQDGILSPVVTPGFLSGVGRSLPAELRRERGLREEHKADTSEEAQRRAERFKRRRRAELIRRGIEAILVGITGWVVLCGGDGRSTSLSTRRGIAHVPVGF